MSWQNPRPNDYSEEALRAIFYSLEQFLSAPDFPNGVSLGDGTGGTYDDTTGTTTPPTLSDVDADTFSGIDTDLTQLQTDLAAAASDITDLEGRFPIQTVDIDDDAITTPKLFADSVTAAKLAAINLAVGKWIASTSYSAGVSGWIIEADGSAEFNDVVVRGELAAGTITGDLVMDGGAFKTAPDGTEPRIIIDSGAGYATLDWQTVESENDVLGSGPTVSGDDVAHPDSAVDVPTLTLASGQLDGGFPSRIQLLGPEGSSDSIIHIEADNVELNGDSLTGAWTAYTPSDTNLTLGDGTKEAAYMLIGKTCFVRYYFRLGTTSSVGTAPTIGLPFAAKNLSAAGYQVLTAGYEEGGTGTQVGIARIGDNASTAVLVHDEGTSGGALTATAPFTWGSTDVIFVTGVYEIE